MRKNRIMCKLTSSIVLILIVIIFYFSNFSIYASSNVSKDNNLPNSMFVSIYDDIAKEYIVKNYRISFNSDLTVINVFSEMKNNELIKDFKLNKGYISSITLNDDTLKNSSDISPIKGYYAKVNGERLSPDNIRKKIVNGDIVEWIYAYESEGDAVDSSSSEATSSQPENVISPPKSQAYYWDSGMTKILNDACDWLDRNVEDSELYLVAIGSAGKTADVKVTNQLANDLEKKNEFNSASELAHLILSATFCGYDVSTIAYGQLVMKLYSYKGITDEGILGAVSALIAYDSNSYTVGDSTLNSRKTLVDKILMYQNSDGGFSETIGGMSDINITATTLATLSSYTTRLDVSDAVDRALSYLSIQINTFDEYNNEYSVKLDNIANIIIALNSLGMDLNDDRFYVDGQTLLEMLVGYRNIDSGFSNEIGEKSSTLATEKAIIALSSIKRGGNPYKLTKLIEPTTESEVTENVLLKRDDASTIIVIAIILAIIGVGIIVISHRVVDKK